MLLEDEKRFQPAMIEKSDQERIGSPEVGAFKQAWFILRQNKGAVVSLVLLILITLLAIFGPYMNEHTYYDTDYAVTYQDAGSEYWFGTDKFGRDQWTRIWQGTRVSLYIAFLAAFLDLIIGVTFGAVSALVGGKTDLIMQRIIDVLVGVPNLIVVILLMLLMKPGILTISLAMVITGWVNMARLIRGEIFKLKEQEFVLAARTLGAKNRRIITKHFLRNTVGLIVINMMFTIPNAIFTEAFLSFIGLGLQEPLASLGVLINDGYESMRNHYHLLLYPAIVIVVLMVSFNMLADGLRDALDPKMRK